MFLAIFAITAILSVVVYLHVTRNFKYWKQRGIEFLEPIPFLGNARALCFLQRSIGTFLYEMYSKTESPLLGFFIFDQPFLLVRCPEIIKHILVKDFNSFHNRSSTVNERDDPIGSFILYLVQNPTWKSLRMKMAPAFSSVKVKSMLPLIVESSEDMKKYVDNLAPENSVIDCRELAMKFATDVISTCSFGMLAHSFESENSDFQIATDKIFHPKFTRAFQIACYFIAPMLVKPLRMKFLDPEATLFLQKVFCEQMNDRQRTKATRGDLVDVLVELKEGGSTNNIRTDALLAQALQLFTAGIETNGTTISFTLYELAKNTDIQTQVREEIRSVLAKSNGITYEALKEMKLLSRVIKETLRMYPPLPFLDRRCTKRFSVPGTEYVIDEGVPVYISLRGLHYDPKYYPNPNKYDPDRFTEENESSRPAHAYLPFGDGPRNCIGLRLGQVAVKVGLAQILSEFEVEVCPTTPIPMEFDQKIVMLAPVNGLDLRIKRCISI